MFTEKVFVVACFNLKLCRDGFGFSAFNTVRLGSFIIQPAVCVYGCRQYEPRGAVICQPKKNPMIIVVLCKIVLAMLAKLFYTDMLFNSCLLCLTRVLRFKLRYKFICEPTIRPTEVVFMIITVINDSVSVKPQKDRDNSY